jgi:MFS transporter, DHA1 family, multidrug resistance protein
LKGTQSPSTPGGVSSRERRWVSNFSAVLLCHFLNFVLIQASFPFIPLYLRQLGESESSAIAWTGAIQVVGSVMMMIANPVWGSLSDRFGRKAMITRAQTAAVAVYGLMGITSHAWQVFALRALQGAVGGSGAPLTTLAAVILPPGHLSLGMGMLQTVQFIGISAGPVLGGLVASAIGFRGTFHMTAGLMVINALIAYLVLREPKDREAGAKRRPTLGFRQGLAFIGRVPTLRAPIIATLSYQAAYGTSVALLPLHLYALTGETTDAAASVGLVLTATALGAALGGIVLGWLGGRLGAATVLLGALFLTALLLVPQAWLTSTTQFAALRFAMGVCAGGVVPALRTVLAEEAYRHESTASSMGAIYGLNQSAFAGGQATGAALAAVVASVWGLASTYLVAAALIGATGVWWLRAVPRAGDQRAAHE